MQCLCGDPDTLGTGYQVECLFYETGYPFCLKCRDHHREWPSCPGITPDGDDAEGEVQTWQAE